MGKVYCFANQKGGVAKTTSTINIAHALVEREKTVLLVDLDPQASLTIYSGQDPVELQNNKATIYEGLTEEEREFSSLVIGENPALIPASLALARAERYLAQMITPASAVRRKLEPLRGNYDFILIDCPPTLTLLTLNGLAAADKVIIPVKTDYLSVMGITFLMDTITEVRKMANPELNVLGIIPTLHNPRNTEDQKALGELHKGLQGVLHIFDPINRSTNFDKSPREAEPTLHSRPDTPGVQGYYQIADYIIHHG